MPGIALFLCLVGFLLLFVLRSFVQWRKTGSPGIHGFHGRVGSLPWFAGMGASLGLLLAPLAPISALLDWPGGALFVSSPPIHLAGAACGLIGTIGAVAAQFSMGDSWRIGVDQNETTELVTRGLFAWVRNPIFSFIWLLLIGLVLVVPNLVALASFLLTAIGIELQVRCVEEPYLLKTHGIVYQKYATQVGRFVPGLGTTIGA